MNIEESRLTVLFESISEATEQRRYPEALRLADNARRFAPDHPAAILIHARLLLKTGNAGAAADSVRGRDDAQSLALHAEAALQAGLTGEAAASCERLLRRFAVDSWPELSTIAAGLCATDPDRFPGWVGLDSRLCLVGALASPGAATIHQHDVLLGTIGDASGFQSSSGFFVDLKPEGQGRIDVRLHGRDLLGSGLHWPPDFGVTGWVVLEGLWLHGEVIIEWDTSTAVTLTVKGEETDMRITVEPAGRGGAARPFSVKLPGLAPLGSHLEVSARLPDGREVALMGSPINLPQPRPRPIASPIGRRPPAPRRISPRPLVNVVVPVYAGADETLACLRSVLATLPASRATVTVVNDASPDLQLRDALQGLADAGRITLLRNTCNLGFPASANRGMRLHRDRDVILLNADTEVFTGWFERLIDAASADDAIGTVTPLGEAASIVSYPGDSLHCGSAAEAAQIDRIAQVVNAGRIVDLPVGVGFCLFIRRRCLDEVGDFDELGFGRGYGEENGFLPARPSVGVAPRGSGQYFRPAHWRSLIRRRTHGTHDAGRSDHQFPPSRLRCPGREFRAR